MKQICKFCKSEIDEDCYKCPVCKEWTHPFRLRRDNPLLKRYVLIALLLFSFLYAPKLIFNKLHVDNLKKYEIKHFKSAEEHQLKILWSKPSGLKFHDKIFAEVKNDGRDTFSSLNVAAYFYDKSNNLIKVEEEYLSNILKAGEKKVFQVNYICSCGKDENIPKTFDHYELKIEGGMID